jgi:hypothetical protein
MFSSSGRPFTQGDQKVSEHLMITVQSSGAQRHSDHPVHAVFTWYVFHAEITKGYIKYLNKKI